MTKKTVKIKEVLIYEREVDVPDSVLQDGESAEEHVCKAIDLVGISNFMQYERPRTSRIYVNDEELI